MYYYYVFKLPLVVTCLRQHVTSGRGFSGLRHIRRPPFQKTWQLWEEGLNVNLDVCLRFWLDLVGVSRMLRADLVEIVTVCALRSLNARLEGQNLHCDASLRFGHDLVGVSRIFRVDFVEIEIFGPICALRPLNSRLEGRNVHLDVSLRFWLDLVGVSRMFRADPVEIVFFGPLCALRSLNAGWRLEM